MTLALLAKLSHVLAAFWMIAGVVGRDFTYWRAGRVSNPNEAYGLLQMSDLFERTAVIPGSAAVLLLGLATAWLQRLPILGFLQGAPANWLLASLVLFLGPTLLIGPLRLAPRRKERNRAAEQAAQMGTITPELTAALGDRIVAAFRIAELIMLALIIAFMVTKAF